jgi:hypothetical protein
VTIFTYPVPKAISTQILFKRKEKENPKCIAEIFFNNDVCGQWI